MGVTGTNSVWRVMTPLDAATGTVFYRLVSLP